MDLDNYNSQSHVAQQSRRNKLRVQQSTQHIEDYPSNLDQLNPNLAQIPNIRYVNLSYEPSLISSEMQDLSTNNSLLLSTHKDTPKDCGDRQNCGPWRSCDWVDNYLGDHNVSTIGEGSMSVTKAYDPPSSLYRGPSYDGYQSSNYTNSSSKLLSLNSQRMYEDMHYNPSLVYQNALPFAMVNTLETMHTEGLGPTSIINQTNTHHWSRDLNSTVTSDSMKQGLSLSLSPDGLVYPNGNLTSDYLTSTSKQSVVASSNKILGNTGPLGPFTGYATILKNSKFLGPAQQLLGDMCIIHASILAHTSEALKNKISNEANGFSDAVNYNDQSRISSPGVSSPRFYSSNESSGEVLWTKAVETFRPEYQQKKEKLLFMHEEVNRRHKQYHQQMEMVVSSFESVSGLSAVTPYISLAVKTVSGNFCSLKDVISEQLKNICKALGDASTSSKGYTSSSRLNFTDQEKLMKQKIDRGNLGISHPHQPHAWRPQRGLPERAVAVLRAWLFEHFLHPYPTDTDKHMLASQTGLTRDQVSNWFINARVRVWKPMVEEIHALETKSMGMEISNSNPDGVATNLPDKPSDLFGTSSNKVAGRVSYGDQWDHAIEKRLRTDYQTPDTSFMSFMPYQRSGLGIDIGGLGPVSLTLGLRQSPEDLGPQQQEQEHELQHFGGQMVHHDFVG